MHKAQQPPSVIQKVMDSINSKYPEKWVNSCLVTKYEDDNEHCPSHSDDELEIGPESNIYTLSIGASRKMEFHKINTKNSINCHVLFIHFSSFAMLSESLINEFKKKHYANC